MERFPESGSWTMWDVALVHAFLDPKMAKERAVSTPPENVQRKIWVYSDLDFDAMYADYWKNMQFWNQ